EDSLMFVGVEGFERLKELYIQCELYRDELVAYTKVIGAVEVKEECTESEVREYCGLFFDFPMSIISQIDPMHSVDILTDDVLSLLDLTLDIQKLSYCVQTFIANLVSEIRNEMICMGEVALPPYPG